jgi:hypothetical protein
LAPFRQRWREEHGEQTVAAEPAAAAPNGVDKNKPMRNHGLLSKASRALEIAGWSPQAQEDVEIFSLVDTDGLTPLLIVLNDAKPVGSLDRMQEAPHTNGSAADIAAVKPSAPAVEAEV